MTGLVPMHEHRRVVEERDALKERVRYLESEIGTPGDVEWFLVHRALKLQPARSRYALVLAKVAPRLVRPGAILCALGSEAAPKILDTYATNVRHAFAAAGFDGPVIKAVYGEGHMMTAAAAAFLRAKVPDAFPATKEPSR